MFRLYESNTDQNMEILSGSVFMAVFKKKWENLQKETGIFRYQINTLHERMVNDKYLIQLNTNRGTKRRMPENISHISQPFDGDKFNFTKVLDKEFMFTLTVNNDASVNHLHYHLLFEHRMLAVQLAKCKLLKGSLYKLEDYVVPTFCINVDQNIKKAAEDIFKLLQYLLQKCIPHNIIITWVKGINDTHQDKIRVYIWPRKSCAGVKNLAVFNVAVCELAGWFPVYDDLEFAKIQREDLEDELRKWKYEEFNELCDEVKSLF